MTDEGTSLDVDGADPAGDPELRDVTARLVATEQELIDLRTARDDEWRVLDGIVRFGEVLGRTDLEEGFWEAVVETVTRTFNCESVLVCKRERGSLRVLCHRGPQPSGGGERRMLAEALSHGVAQRQLDLAGDGRARGLQFQGRTLEDLLAVQAGSGDWWIVVSRTERKRASFRALEARQLSGLQLIANHVTALYELYASRARVVAQMAELDRVNAELARRIEWERRAAERQVRLREQLADARRMESIGRLAGGVAHDFNNLLMVVNGNSEMLLEESLPGESHQMVQEIGQAGARAAALTQQLLAYSRRQVIRPSVQDVNALIEERTWMHQKLLGDDIAFEFVGADRPTPVRVDSEQFSQLLENLLLNGRDAIRAVTDEAALRRLQVRTSVRERDPHLDPAGPSVVIEVSDTGCGMDEDTLKRAFEPFFTTKAVGEGAGLGLATAQGVIEQNGGSISVRSEVDDGTTIEVHWPLDGEYKPASTLVEPSDDGRQTGPVVLLVDDDPKVRRFMTRGLQRRRCVVHDFESGEDAIQFIERGRFSPDVLVTDVVMPGMNGREVADAVTARLPTLPVLFVSGYTADIVARNGVLGEGVDLLEKPFSVKVLLSRIERLVGGGPPDGGAEGGTESPPLARSA